MRLIKFEKSGCMPCKKMDKILEQLNVEVEHINVDEDIDNLLIKEYNIQSVPVLLKIYDNRADILCGVQHTIDEFRSFCQEDTNISFINIKNVEIQDHCSNGFCSF